MKILNVQEIGGGLQLIDVGRFEDHRGYFMETFRKSELREALWQGELPIVQGNESFSLPNVMRGLHFQSKPYMGKLVRTISGHMIDIAMDIRQGSPTYGKAFLINMPELPGVVQWLWVPVGFAHGNMFLAPTRIEYLCTGEYNGKSEFGISPLDGNIEFIGDDFTKAVQESFSHNFIMTDKDRFGMSLKAWEASPYAKEFVYGEC